MNNEKDGGPAFPASDLHVNGVTIEYRGMTLRDYFAAMAMQGFCANPSDAVLDFNPAYEKYEKGTVPEEYKQAAERAYLIAAAMLEKRGGE